MTNQHPWWQKGIIYQIYPRSYQDSNGDGIGDLPGIIQRLDYLKNLNVDAVWLSPIYPSPMHDFGYDVADYCNIHPLFGTLADFDHLLAETHRRGLKLILDLVPNHTSNEHPWFVESRSSLNNPKRDWYIWKDPAPDGGPPNNWLSVFGGPAWTLDETTGQYYLHQFVKQQPELNYQNPAVLAAMLNNMRFWLDKGVDGFRVDVISLMAKDPQFRNEPPNPDWDGTGLFNSLQHIYTQNLPEVHPIIRQMRAVLDEYDDRMMVGEIFLPFPDLMKYYGKNLDECHLPFNFHLIARGEFHHTTPWRADVIRKIAEEYEAALPRGGWPNWVLGNHDVPRVASRAGQAQARVAAMLLLTLRGTPTCYYGDELGMENVKIPPEFVQDPPAVNQPEIADLVGRDPVRSPMQWSDGPNAGFTAKGVQPWLPVAPDARTRNVAVQSAQPDSMLNLFRALTRLHRAEPALHAGEFTAFDSPDGTFLFGRALGADRFLVALNFSAEPTSCLAPEGVDDPLQLVLSTDNPAATGVVYGKFHLRPNEGIIFRITPP